jgi:hypothetical protein
MDEINDLKGKIGKLEEERENAVGDERRDKLLAAITAGRNNLDRLYTQLEREQQQQQQGMSLILFMIFIRNLPPFVTIV